MPQIEGLSLPIDLRDPSGASTTDVLLGVIASMTEADGVDAALTRLAELALDATSADRCAILVLHPTRREFLVPAAAATRIGDPARQWRLFKGMEPIDVNEVAARRLLLGDDDVLTIADVASSPIVPSHWREVFGSRSVALAPLRIGDEHLGVLAIDYVVESHQFSTGEVDLFRSISSAASLALREARLLQDVRRRAELERQLAECTAVLLSGRSIREVMATIADAFDALLPGMSFAINLLSPDRASFRPIVRRGSVPVQADYGLDELPAEDVAAIFSIWESNPHQPIPVDDLSAYPAWRTVAPEGIGSALIVPLADDGVVVGFISAGRPSPAFSREEIAVAKVFAGHAAIAVTRATLRDAGRAREGVIEALSRLSDHAGRITNLRALMSTLNKDLTEDLGVRCVRLAFNERLALPLKVPELNEAERGMVRAWREDSTAVSHGNRLAVPISVGGKVAGVIWLEARGPETVTAPIASAIASAIGDVVWKARSRRNEEQRSVELALARDRERIAQDLHDTVGQLFYSIGLRLHDVATRTTDDELRATLIDLRSQAAAGMSEVRSAVYAQSFLRTNRAGLSSSIRELTQRFTRATGIPIEVHLESKLGRISPDVAQALTRVAHESLVNMERHARASRGEVSLRKRDGQVVLEISDDGVGLVHRNGEDWRGSAHFGMRSMQRSIEALGGKFSVRVNLPCGLRVSASIPPRSVRPA